MSGFNVPNTEYRTRMQYYELLDIVNQRKVYNPIPKSFYGDYSRIKSIDSIGANQGIVSYSAVIRTKTTLDIKIGSKVVFHNKEYNVIGENEIPHTMSSNKYTNRPSNIERFIQVDG